MPYKDPEKRREYARKWYETNSEKINEYVRINKEKIKEKNKNFKENNPKKVKKYKWKFNGLNMENFEEIYIRYEMAIFCDICECVLNVEGDYNTTKCMDHDHDTGDFRNIVCQYCNIHICK